MGMKFTWLGQAGLLAECNGQTIVIDPYLSDFVKTVEPKNYRRKPVDERFLRIHPDVIVITHNHLDHLDLETLKYYLTEDCRATVLVPNGGWQVLRREFPNTHCNYVLFNAGTEWTSGDVCFSAVYAEHSDPCAIGVIVCAEGKNYYVTGDTLYNSRVFASLPQVPIEALFLPINGVGNNMNVADAKRFAARVNAKNTVPIHFGLFDEMNGTEFDYPGAVIPEIYRDIKLK